MMITGRNASLSDKLDVDFHQKSCFHKFSAANHYLLKKFYCIFLEKSVAAILWSSCKDS